MSRPVPVGEHRRHKDIRPSTAITICDVCGRTLLRGEHADVYINGGARRSVCELCKTRALHEGWVREGTVPTYDGGEAPTARRRSLLGRLRRRRERERVSESLPPEEPIDEPEAEPQPPPPRAPRRRPREPTREPRHVRAVPTSAEHKMLSAVEVFNDSEHRGRSPGSRGRSASRPSRSPNEGHPSLVDIVVSWELCWYRYEVDLSDEQPVVRVAAQGYELDELTQRERESNAAADDHGALGPL